MSLDVYLTCSLCGDVNYEDNITHNLNSMAEEAGIYKHLWRPEEIEITRASQLIEPLQIGLKRLKEDPTHFKSFDSPNRWGVYENFIGFVENYLAACVKYPEATVRVSR